MKKTSELFNNIELIRVIAMIMLLFHHYQALSGAVFSRINFYGNSGWSYGYLTEIFFTISGFFIAYKSADILQNGFFKYIKNKLIRIYPFVFISSLFFLVVSLIYLYISGNWMYGEKYSLVQIIAGFFLMDRGWIIDFTPAFNGPIWYVDILFICYWLYYLVNLFEKKIGIPKYIIPVVISAIACVLNLINIDYPFLFSTNRRGYIAFFMGVAISEFRKSLIAQNRQKLLPAVGVLGIILYGIAIGVLGRFNYYGMAVILYPSIILLAVSIPQIKFDIIGKAGKYQFQAYLWNVPLFRLGTLISFISGVIVPKNWIIMIIFTLFIEIVAWETYKLIEEPLLNSIKKGSTRHRKEP